MRADEYDVRSHFTGWGAQTIVYAMLVKAEGLGRKLNPSTDLKFAEASKDEALRIAQLELWPKAMKQTDNLLSDETGIIFCQLVLDWCAKHMGSTKPAK